MRLTVEREQVMLAQREEVDVGDGDTGVSVRLGVILGETVVGVTEGLTGVCVRVGVILGDTVVDVGDGDTGDGEGVTGVKVTDGVNEGVGV